MLELAGYVALVVMYGDLANAIKQIDLSMLKYLAENQCLDGSLGRSIDVYAGQFKSDNGLIGVAFAFAILSIVSKLIMVVCCNTCLYGKICCREKGSENLKPNFEKKASEITQGIKRKLTIKRGN